MLGIYYISSSNSQLTDKVDFTQVYTACIQVGQFFLLSFDQNRKYVRNPQKSNILPPMQNTIRIVFHGAETFFSFERDRLYCSFSLFPVKKCLVSGSFFVKVMDWNLAESFCKQICYFNLHIGKIVSFPTAMHCGNSWVVAQFYTQLLQPFMRLFTLKIQI